MKIAAERASTNIRLRPSIAFASGSWASTITTVLTKKMTPMPASLTEACCVANGGSTIETCA